MERNKRILALSLVIIPTVSIILPPAGVILILMSAIYFATKNDSSTLMFFVCSILMQNITLLIGANRFNSTWTTLFSLSKELMLYGCVAIAILRSHMISKKILPFFLFLIVVLFEFVCSSAPIYAKIVSFRQMMLPFVCFLFGMLSKINIADLKKISRFIILASLVVGIIGILEVIVFKDKIWTLLPIARYQENRGAQFALFNGVPLNYYTFDYVAITHRVLRRLVSIFTDPLMTAHFLYLGFVLSDWLMKNGTKKTIVKIFLFIASIMTLCKGIFLAYIVYFALMKLKKYSYKSIKNAIMLSTGFIIAGFVAVYEISSRFLSDSSIIIHMDGFIQGITNGGLFGNGLGKAGVMVYVLANAEESLSGESYIGVITAQIGIIGLLIFIGFWFCIFFRLLRNKRINELSYYCAILLIAVLMESFFSESSIGIVGTGIYFILSGICMDIPNKTLLINMNGEPM